MIDKRIIGKKPKSLEIFLIAKKIFNIIVTIIFIPILVISVFMLAQTLINKDTVPNIGGYEFFIITSGSMEPQINVNDFIVIKKYDTKELQKDDIITFKQEKAYVTHRIIDITKQSNQYYFTTKGDNNNIKDDKQVSESEVEGKYILTIPFLGEIISFIQKPAGLVVLILIPILLTLINHKINDSINEKEIERKNKRIAYKKNINDKNTKGED